jgi:hypothetical protein
MEFIGYLVAAILLFIFAGSFMQGLRSGGTKVKRSQSLSTPSGTGKNFLSPIPKGYQIYADALPIAGMQFRKSEAIKFAKSSNQGLSLEREPNNEHDPNAIKLIGLSSSTKYFLGYLPKEISAQIVTTGLAESVKARLVRIYLRGDDYLDIQYQVIGPKTDKKRFDEFLNNQPADASQKEYLKFFGLPVPKGMDSGEAAQAIAEHRKNSKPEEQDEWDGYSSILDEFDDPGFRETYDLKKVGKTILLDALAQLRKQGKSYKHLADNIDEVVGKVIELKPDLEK